MATIRPLLRAAAAVWSEEWDGQFVLRLSKKKKKECERESARERVSASERESKGSSRKGVHRASLENGLLAGCMALHGLKMASACDTDWRTNHRSRAFYCLSSSSLSPSLSLFLSSPSSSPHPSPPLHLRDSSFLLPRSTSPHRHPYHLPLPHNTHTLSLSISFNLSSSLIPFHLLHNGHRSS